MANIEFKGLEAFKRDLEQLDLSKRRSALVAAALKAVEPIQEDASADAPVDTGRLSREIIIKEDKKNNDLTSVSVDVGASAKAFYGFFQEYGTAFMTAQPFLEPAVERNTSEVESSLAELIDQEISKALAG